MGTQGLYVFEFFIIMFKNIFQLVYIHKITFAIRKIFRQLIVEQNEFLYELFNERYKREFLEERYLNQLYRAIK